MKLTRREMIQATAGGAAAMALRQESPALAPGGATLFHRRPIAVVDELSDMIIPTDRSGRRRAGAWRPTSMSLAESFDPSRRRAGGRPAGGRGSVARVPARRLWIDARARLAGSQRDGGRGVDPRRRPNISSRDQGLDIRAYYVQIGIHEDSSTRERLTRWGSSGVDRRAILT